VLYKESSVVNLALMAFLTAALPAMSVESQPVPVVIRNATIFDAVKGVMLPDRTIVIVGGRIQAIGSPQQRVKIPAGARVIKARGKYVIPGLIESHAHLVFAYSLGHATSYDVLFPKNPRTD
jgi:imidazolonepropionase-like amidohydrolase